MALLDMQAMELETRRGWGDNDSGLSVALCNTQSNASVTLCL